VVDFFSGSETFGAAVPSAEQSIEAYTSARSGIWPSSSAFIKSRYTEFCFPICEIEVT
jgi:hypothetical protein